MKQSLYLVGSNPLPIAIALAYDCGLVEGGDSYNEEDRIHFYYSEETGGYCKKIINWLKKKFEEKGLQFDSNNISSEIIDDVYNSYFVYHEYLNSFKGIFQDGNNVDKLVINVSGGTKVMATNFVLALSNFAASSESSLIKDNVSEIDIDPDKNLLRINNPFYPDAPQLYPSGGKTVVSIYGDLISIDDIVDLYEYSKLPSNSKFTLGSPENTIEFGNKIIEKLDIYRKFQDMIFSLRDLDKSIGKLKQLNIHEKDLIKLSHEPIKSLISCKEKQAKACDGSFIQSWYDNLENRLSDDKTWFVDFLVLSEILERDTSDAPRYVMSEKKFKYLTGVWLEEYIWAILRSMIKNRSGFEIQNNFVVHSNDVKSNENTFEIDLVFRRGFDITFISCTTDEGKYLSNSKTREVLANSEALGLRTRTVLVTMCKRSSKEFAERYKAFSTRHYKNLKIICLEDLENIKRLEKRLCEIFDI